MSAVKQQLKSLIAKSDKCIAARDYEGAAVYSAEIAALRGVLLAHAARGLKAYYATIMDPK